MEAKPKRANFVLLDDVIVIECPFCGRTLLRTDYDRIKKLFNQIGAPPGKLCPKCGGVAVLQLGSVARKEVLSKIQRMRSENKPDPGDMLLE
jgi:predicted RNA-binding Zn-ribbon protein involved in translation (DUF1610 family)